MFDKELGAVHRPNSYNTNSVINNWGFRNTNDIPEQKPEDATRIYCSGGSTTFCYNLPTEESWPSILQRKLRQIPGHENDEVLNAGELCFAISHEFVLAKRLIPVLKPDIVILYGTGINEWPGANLLVHTENYNLDRLLSEKRWGIFSRKLDQARFLKRNSTFVKFFDYKVKQWLEKVLTKKYRDESVSDSNYHLHPWIIDNFDHVLRAYLEFLRNNGCKVIIVRYGDNDVEDWFLNNCVRLFRDYAVNIGIEEGAIICDFNAVVEQHPRRKDFYIDTGCHVTAEGAELLSDVLMEAILNMQKTENLGVAVINTEKLQKDSR